MNAGAEMLLRTLDNCLQGQLCARMERWMRKGKDE